MKRIAKLKLPEIAKARKEQEEAATERNKEERNQSLTIMKVEKYREHRDFQRYKSEARLRMKKAKRLRDIDDPKNCKCKNEAEEKSQ